VADRLLIAVVWVSYAVVFFGTIAKRKVPHIYVANWFFGAFIITVACCTSSTTWRCRCR
jgi:cytochrome c oxidase cbb3-type subunit I